MTCIDVTIPPVTSDRPLLLVAAAALIDKDGHILLAERPAGKSMAGLWEFPGGKIGPNETPEAALVRELKEELGVETSAGCLWPLAFASHAYETFHLLMPLFACRVWSGDPAPREGQRIMWATKKELRNFDMPPADKPLVEVLQELL
jgi:8-oxo-dGTP diphosphatase